MQSSLPSLDRNSLVLSAETFTQNELSTLTVRIGVSDPDGTTDDVRVNITLGMQQWEANLSDDDGDGVWEGSLEWRPETTGAHCSRSSPRTVRANRPTSTSCLETWWSKHRKMTCVVCSWPAQRLPFVSIAGLVAFMVARRRRALEEIDLLTSWDAFKAPSQEATSEQKPVPALEENVMDGTEEVQAELDLEFD